MQYEGEKRREGKANAIAIGLMEELSWPPYKFEVFGPPFFFLREGAICYINGTFLASSLMARASVETAVYLAISTDIYTFDSTKKVDLSYIHDRWDRILARAYNGKANGKTICKGLRLLSSADVKDIEYIRKYGNTAAHWGQQAHRKFKEKQSKATKQKKSSDDSLFTFQNTIPSISVTRLMPNEEKATKVLEKSISVLKALSKRI